MLTFSNFLSESLLLEKLIVYGGGAKYGQVVFLAGGGGCFAPDTLIKMSDNTFKKISDINTGDFVQSLNTANGQVENKEVAATHVFPANKPLVEVYFEDGVSVICTEDHEFFVGGQWVQAKNLV